MKQLFFSLIIFLTYSSYSQIDAVKIASAKKAIENADNQIALDALNEVSAVGRSNKMYLYYKGIAFYNINQYDSAEVYLKKYLLKDVNNTEIAEKLADIDYQKKKKIKDEQLKEQKRIEKEKCIEDCSICYGKGIYDDTKEVSCTACNGKGEKCFLCKSSKVCFGCKGKGEVVRYAGSNLEQLVTCNDCSGSGKCNKCELCWLCKGSTYETKHIEKKCYHPYCK